MPVRPFQIQYNASDLYSSDVVVDSPEDGFRVSASACLLLDERGHDAPLRGVASCASTPCGSC